MQAQLPRHGSVLVVLDHLANQERTMGYAVALTTVASHPTVVSFSANGTLITTIMRRVCYG